MFQTKWFRAVLVMAVLASLLVAPLLVSAQEAATTSGITAPADGATVSGTVTVTGNVVGDLSKWELLLFGGGDIQDNNKAWLDGGDTAGEFSYDLDTTKYPDGTHALVLRVVHADSNYTDYPYMVTFANAEAPVAVEPTEAPAVAATAPVTPTAAPAAAVAAPVAESGITAPEADASVSGTVAVAGTVVGDLSRWELLLFPNNVVQDSNKVWLAGGDAAGSVSYDLDTTKYPDGDHALVLRVVKADSNYTDYPHMVTFANAGATPAAATAVVTATATPAATAAVTATATPAPAPAAPTAPATESSITAPKVDETVSGTVAVTGNVVGDLSKWELLLFPNGNVQDSNKAWLTGGDAAGAISYDLDTTKYPDGKHVLVLRVVNANSNYTDIPVMVTFANAPAAPAQ